MPETAVLEPPPSVQPQPSPPTRSGKLWTNEGAKRAAAASVAARQLKARQRKDALFQPPAQPTAQLPTQERRVTRLVVAQLPREENALSQAGDKVRETLAKSLAAQAVALSEKGFKRADLTGRDGTAQATKTLADAAATVFGWGDTTPGGLIVVGEVERAMEAGQVAAPELAAGSPGGPALDVAAGPAVAPDDAGEVVSSTQVEKPT